MTSAGSIEWNDGMLTGVAEIDRQHRILVDTLIDARAKLSGDASSRVFEQVTRDLLAYAIYHFTTEEQLMERYGYATAAAGEAEHHLAEHRRFSDQIVALRDDVRRGKPGAQAALLAFLEGWLAEHILATDKRFVAHIFRSTAPDAGP